MTHAYLAGPMRSVPNYNFPLFDRVADLLRTYRGWTVFNPADLDREMGWVNDWTDGTARIVTLTNEFDWDEAIQRDLEALAECDTIVMLPGWSRSQGARIELAAALKQNKAVKFWIERSDGSGRQVSMFPLPDEEHEWAKLQARVPRGKEPGPFQRKLGATRPVTPIEALPQEIQRLLDDECRQAASSDEHLHFDYADQIVLDQSDPFEKVLVDVVATNRRKRADYALDGDPFSNFRQAAEFAGVDVQTVLNVMLGIKQARLLALEANDRDPQNESVLDSVLDRAVYGVIALALAHEAGTAEQGD